MCVLPRREGRGGGWVWARRGPRALEGAVAYLVVCFEHYPPTQKLRSAFVSVAVDNCNNNLCPSVQALFEGY